MKTAGENKRRWNTSGRGVCCIGWLLGCWLVMTSVSVLADRMELIEGEVVETSVQSISEDGRWVLAGVALREIDGADVRLFAGKSPEAQRQGVEATSIEAGRIYIRGGGWLVVQGVRLENRMVVMDQELLGRVTLPLDEIAALSLGAPGEPGTPGEARSEGESGWEKELAAAERSQGPMMEDRIGVRSASGLQWIEGVVEALDDEALKLVWKGETRTIKRERVQGMVLGGRLRAEADQAKGFYAWVTMGDGSSWRGRLLSMEDGKLRAELAGVAVALDWAQVVRVEAENPRLKFLSAMEPVQVRENFFPSAGWAWQRDRSVTGEVLRVGEMEYKHGLGVHARCELEYEIGGEYQWFMARIGLQQGWGDKGDCVYVVMGDEKELLRQRIQGAAVKAEQAGVEIKVNVTGVRRLKLLVEAGENFDMADHANWADARLIKAR